MRIGIPRERKNGETRVSLTPEQVQVLSSDGHSVLVETGAGAGSFFPDREYLAAGAKIAKTLEATWLESDLIVKVKEPSPDEYTFFREDLIVFSFLHPAAFPKMTKALVKANCQAYSYDLLEDEQGRLPILHPMSVIAGTISLYAGSNALFTSSGARGVLLSEVCGLAAGRVLIFGAGSAGTAAAQTAIGFGANTHIVDINPSKLGDIKAKLPSLNIHKSSDSIIDEQLSKADLIVSAVLIPGDSAPKLITEPRLDLIKPGAAFVDISIDQGGASISSRPTTIENPTYIEKGIVHYCVPNIPALVAKTSTLALTKQTFDYVRALASGDNSEKFEKALSSALVCSNGEIKNKTVKNALIGTIR